MKRSSVVLFIFVATLMSHCTGSTGEALRLAADRLVATQLGVGDDAGGWEGDLGFTGSIAVGLAAAYRRTCRQEYLEAARAAAEYIHRVSGEYYGYGDDAWAMAMLSETSDDPQNNPYRNGLEAFYANVRAGQGGTAEFIDYYTTGTEPSTAVFYLAHHCMAAHYVDAMDETLFRDAVRHFLSQVDDETAEWPVLALGVATWALASTGPLDETPLDPAGMPRPIWEGVRPADLPALLLGHQVDAGPGAGQFYWRFDHTDGNGGTEGVTCGFTEDTIFGALGLATLRCEPVDPNMEQALTRSRLALAAGVDSEGTVGPHLQEPGDSRAVFAGELLAALVETSPAVDTNLDNAIDTGDLVPIATAWLQACSDGCLCGGADVNDDGVVNLPDFAAVARMWLTDLE